MEIMQRYERLSDKLYQSSQSWGSHLEQLLVHPVQYCKDTFSHQEVRKDWYYTAAISTVTVPLYALFETTAGELSDPISAGARALSIPVNYAMISYLKECYDNMKKKWERENKAPWKRWLIGAGYVAVFVIGLKIASYLISGEDDIDKIVLNTGAISVAAAILYRPLIKVMEAFSKLAGYDGEGYEPKMFKKMQPSRKKKLALGWLALGVAATVVVYAAIPKKPEKQIAPAIQVVENLPKLEAIIE